MQQAFILLCAVLCHFAGLTPPLRQDWRLLFNSAKHGMSYSTFLGRLGDASLLPITAVHSLFLILRANATPASLVAAVQQHQAWHELQ
jgi:hypothetical protein